MLNLWEKSRAVLYFDDGETDRGVTQTINNLRQDPEVEDLEKFTNAIDALSDHPMTHFLVENTQRYVVE